MFENIDDNGYVIGSVDENTTVINTEVGTVKAYDSDITPAFKTVSGIWSSLKSRFGRYNEFLCLC